MSSHSLTAFHAIFNETPVNRAGGVRYLFRMEWMSSRRWRRCTFFYIRQRLELPPNTLPWYAGLLYVTTLREISWFALWKGLSFPQTKSSWLNIDDTNKQKPSPPACYFTSVWPKHTPYSPRGGGCPAIDFQYLLLLSERISPLDKVQGLHLDEYVVSLAFKWKSTLAIKYYTMKACMRRGGKVPRVLVLVNGGEEQAHSISGVKTIGREWIGIYGGFCSGLADRLKC